MRITSGCMGRIGAFHMDIIGFFLTIRSTCFYRTKEVRKCSFTARGLSGIKDFHFWIYQGPLAHPVEHLTLNQRVAGSSPARPTSLNSSLKFNAF